MNHDAARFLAGLGFLATIVLGLVPLVQWFVFDHRNGLIRVLFGNPNGPWVWICPLIVIAIGFVLMAVFGEK